MKSFSELPLSAPLKSNLVKHGFVEPTPVQALAIEPALAGRDLVATAQTGTGKTLAFVLPILQHHLAISPKQPAVLRHSRRRLEPHARARHADPRHVRQNGGRHRHSRCHRRRRPQRECAIEEHPQRLASADRHPRTTARTFSGRNLVDLRNVRILVLDEADRMLDMGFLPTVKKIIAATPADRQTLLFSATIQSSVKHLVQTHVRNAVRIEVGDTTKPIDEDRAASLRSGAGPQARPACKSCSIRSKARSWSSPAPSTAPTSWPRSWRAKVVKTAAIHGNRSQSQRTQALRGFQDGDYRVLVATDVASRGIHVEGIAHVVNYDLPQVPEDFIHRVGRTGRAGATGNGFHLRHALGALADCADRAHAGRQAGAPGPASVH